MKKRTFPGARGRSGGKLPEEACHACGAVVKSHRGTWTYAVNGEDVAVPSTSYMKCFGCGEMVIEFAELKRVHASANILFRKKHGLLSPDEIRAIRKRYKLTQADLARLLRLGGNTISRWESGRNVQTGAMDILLRLIRDLPGSLAWLRKNAA